MIRTIASLPTRALDGIGAGVILTILGAVYALGVHPTLDRRAAAELDRRTLASELAAADAAATELRNADQLREQLLSGRSRNLTLQPADQINSRIALLTELAAEQRIAIQQLTPSVAATIPGKPYMAVPMKVQGTGEFADCIAFLGRLRSQYRDIAVPSIGLTVAQPASENQPSRLDMALDLVWYAASDGSAGTK
jgi:Tfp pilus assembly protein PilO